MAKKNITIDDLAKMINKGFQGTAEQIDELEVWTKEKLNILENEVKIIRKHQIIHTIYRDEFEKLENRVAELENMLDFTAKKH